MVQSCVSRKGADGVGCAVSIPVRGPPAPVPRFVGDTLGIAPRIRKVETEFAGMFFQPAKLGRPGETFLQIGVPGRTEVERVARVMLAATGHGVYPENVRDPLAVGQFATDDESLARHAPKR